MHKPKEHVAAAKHPTATHHAAGVTAKKFAALTRRLTAAHPHPAVAHVSARVAASPGVVVPLPDYYPPGPYRRLVYGGPPPGPYGWGGYRGRYPYFVP